MKERINIRKITITVITINIIQMIVIFSFAVLNYLNRNHNAYDITEPGNGIIFYSMVFVIFTSSFITIKNIYSMAFINSDSQTMKNTLDQLENLNRTLRAQRHDFINHLQVVYSLMELEEYPEAREYIEKVYNDIQKVNRALKTSNPAVNALLQAKLISGEKKNIEMELKINSKLDKLIIPSWEFCRVLGNIIDNAIYALNAVEGQKEITIEIFEDLKNYEFRISNNGPKIPAEIKNRIFEPGFTTKGGAGEGMGLAITRDIITRYGGKIMVISDADKTVFEGWIPKQN